MFVRFKPCCGSLFTCKPTVTQILRTNILDLLGTGPFCFRLNAAPVSQNNTTDSHCDSWSPACQWPVCNTHICSKLCCQHTSCSNLGCGCCNRQLCRRIKRRWKVLLFINTRFLPILHYSVTLHERIIHAPQDRIEMQVIQENLCTIVKHKLSKKSANYGSFCFNMSCSFAWDVRYKVCKIYDIW